MARFGMAEILMVVCLNTFARAELAHFGRQDAGWQDREKQNVTLMDVTQRTATGWDWDKHPDWGRMTKLR